jgi:hypothetical protein
LCSDERKLAAAKKQKVRADVLFLGRVNGRAVYDILYYFNDDPKPNWKSLVVQRSGDRYGEVLQVHDYTREGIHHSTLVKEGDQQLIYAVDNCDRSGCSSVCFRIDRDGPVFVDIPPSDR